MVNTGLSGESKIVPREDGFDITVSGKVYAGDSFKIEINTDAPGDNSNGLKMCALQTDGMVIKGTNSKIAKRKNYRERNFFQKIFRL